jgi:mannosyl-3-phosphoglycerate phosphatase family protein
MVNHRVLYNKSSNPGRMLLFTGVDGTLLDEETFDTTTATAALNLLRQHQIPVVFCSSKTFSEQEYWQKKLHLKAPFIFENGSGIAIPKGYFPEDSYVADGFHGDYDIIILARTDAFHVKNTLARINRIYGTQLRGYGDCPPEEISRITHLHNDQVARACDRMFTEILLSPVDERTAELLRPQLAGAGLTLGKNARFNSIQAADIDKGKAVLYLKDIFAAQMDAPPILMAVGDSANDEAMLQAAQIRFLVQRPGNNWVPMHVKGLNHLPAVGPEGFLKAVQLMLEE